MRRTIRNIAIVLAASCLPTSCENDNYDEPNSDAKGCFIDAETSEIVPMSIQGASNIQIRIYGCNRYYSTGDDHLQLPVVMYPKINGACENSWMFNKQYILTLGRTNFYSVDTMVVNLSVGGLTDRNIKMIPYTRIDVDNVVLEGKELRVSYTITRSRDNCKIENVFLARYISLCIGKMPGNSEESVTVDYTSMSDKDILNTVLTQETGLSKSASLDNKDRQAIIRGNGSKMYVRVGVVTNGEINYSEVVPINVSF